MKHTTWMHTRRNAEAKAEHIQFEGRKLLGQLMQSIRLGGLFAGKMERTLGDGTKLIARFDGTTPIVEVYGKGKPSEPIATIDNRPGIWIPQGFVLYPVSDSEPRGWGLPVIPASGGGIGQPTPDIYDNLNLAPGLDVQRWTAEGPLGQVLLTQAGGAGYPSRKRDVAPLMFHATKGIKPKRLPAGPASDDPWAAYRMEFDAYTPQSPDASKQERTRIVAFKRELAQLTNEHRDSEGLDPLPPPIRGRHDSAQVSAENMAFASVQGHFYDGFWPTHKGTPDRFTHDGFMLNLANLPLTPAQWSSRNAALGGAENMVSHDGDFTVIGTDPNGIDITRLDSAGSLTAAYAFEKLLDSTVHRANIESTVFDYEGQTPASATTLACGYRQGFGVQHFQVHEQWIGHGNASWESEHPEIPILSWLSFNSASLAWETWPIRPRWFTTRAIDNTITLTAEYVQAGYLTQDIGSAAPIASIFYTDVADGGATDRRTRPALSPRVFARGRCIGVVPRGGLVWSAGVQKIGANADATPPTPTTYRLLVLAHHADEQSSDVITDGMTGVLHLWFYDMPLLGGVACNPQCLIRDVYGEEVTDFPWITTESPYSWRDGGMVSVNGASDLLKYASLWRFSPNGRKAICLRDQGTKADYERMFVIDSMISATSGDLVTVNLGAGYLAPAGQIGQWHGGPRVCALELTFAAADVDTAPDATLIVWDPNKGSEGHRLKPTFESINGIQSANGAWVRPAAADYDAAGNPVFAHHVHARYALSHELIWSDDSSSGYADNRRRGMLFTSNYDAIWSDAVASATWYSDLIASEGGTGEWCSIAMVIDVRDRMWATIGQASPAVDEGAHPVNSGRGDYPDYLSSDFAVTGSVGHSTTACDSCVLGADPLSQPISMRLWRDNTTLNQASVTRNDNLIYDLTLVTFSHPGGAGSLADPVGVPVLVPGWRWGGWCAPAANPCVSAGFGRKAASWVAAIAYLPQAGLALTMATTGGVYTAPSVIFDPPLCFNSCGRDPWWGVTLFYASSSAVAEGGGWVGSSFATQAELADMMQIPGSNVRSLGVGVV